MTSSVMLAQFWGWLTITMSLIYFARPSLLREVKTLMIESRPFSIFYGLASVILGIASVVAHNKWSIEEYHWLAGPSLFAYWPIAVTVFGWACLVKGIIVLTWPELARKPRLETRLLTTRIALVVAVVFASLLLMASRGL